VQEHDHAGRSFVPVQPTRHPVGVDVLHVGEQLAGFRGRGIAGELSLFGDLLQPEPRIGDAGPL
jgi:hypothetical protein